MKLYRILNNIRKLIKRHFFYLIYISKQKVYFMKNRVKQFNSDLSFGKWGEQTIYPWIEKYFTRGDINVSYWYDSDYEARKITDRTKKKEKLNAYLFIHVSLKIININVNTNNYSLLLLLLIFAPSSILLLLTYSPINFPMTSTGNPFALFRPLSTPDCACIIIFMIAEGDILTRLKNL